MAEGVVVIKDLETARRYATETPLHQARIEEAARAVIEEGDKAWDWIEPLAGLLFPRIEREVKRLLADWPKRPSPGRSEPG